MEMGKRKTRRAAAGVVLCALTTLASTHAQESSAPYQSYDFFGENFCVVESSKGLGLDDAGTSFRWSNAPRSFQLTMTLCSNGSREFKQLYCPNYNPIDRAVVLNDPSNEDRFGVFEPTWGAHFAKSYGLSERLSLLDGGRVRYVSEGYTSETESLSLFVFEAQCFKSD